MKIVLFCFVILAFSYCRESIIEIPEIDMTGNIYISSFPLGAEIFLNSNRLTKITPDSLVNLQPGNYQIKLRMVGFQDQTVYVDVRAGSKRYVNVTLMNNLESINWKK